MGEGSRREDRKILVGQLTLTSVLLVPFLIWTVVEEMWLATAASVCIVGFAAYRWSQYFTYRKQRRSTDPI